MTTDTNGAGIGFLLCVTPVLSLCLCGVKDEPALHHRGTESTEVAHRNPKLEHYT